MGIGVESWSNFDRCYIEAFGGGRFVKENLVIVVEMVVRVCKCLRS